MHKKQKTINVVKSLHKYQDNLIQPPEIIKEVCEYYDFIKNDKLNQNDLQFLNKLANAVGIPHYFDHLNNFQQEAIALDIFSLSTISAQIYESTLYTDEQRK